MNILSIITALESLVIDAQHIDQAKNLVINHLKTIEGVAEQTVEATAQVAEAVVNIIK